MRMLAETFPEFTWMLDQLDELLTEKRPVDEKTYQFICFVLSIKGRSKPCVLKHFKSALDAGATVEELNWIFALTEGCNVGRPSEAMAPIFIGATVSVLIAVLAPLTQCGINPARDFGPRLIAWLAGWDIIAIPGPHGGFFWVYILAPMLGGIVAALSFRFVVSPLMGAKQDEICGCKLKR